MKPLFLCLLAASLATLGACNRDRSRARDHDALTIISEREIANPNEQDRSGVATLTNASLVGGEAAIDRIVNARCAREATCDNIGAGKLFSSGEMCAREARSRMREELRSMTCWAGVDSKKLDECLGAIRGKDCAEPVDSVNRIAACRTHELCLNAEVPR